MNVTGHRLLSPALFICVVMSSAGFPLPVPQSGGGSVLGDGRGVDHVGVFVRNLDEVNRVYGETLGFKIYPGGSFPDGVSSSGILLEKCYLELLTVDPLKATGEAIERVRFLREHEGAVFLALNVSSAQTTAEFLGSRGFEVTGPQGGSVTPKGASEPAPELYRTVHFKRAIAPAETFFIEYTRRPAETPGQSAPPNPYRQHPNTARRIASVWIAVKNLEEATRAYESLGLKAGRRLRLSRLGAKGQEIEAGQGVLLLLQPESRRGVVASFLSQRGEAIIGVSIEVGSVETARGILETNIKRKFAPYNGAYGHSVLIPSELTHGLWIEMFHK